MNLLQSYEITPTLAIRIYRQYGEGALEHRQGIPLSPRRRSAWRWLSDRRPGGALAGCQPHRCVPAWGGLRHVLSEAAGDGHCYLPADLLVDRTAKLLEVDVSLIETTLRNVDAMGDVHIDEVDGLQHVYLLPFYRAELGVANAIRTLQIAPSAIAPMFKRFNWDTFLGSAWAQTRSPADRKAARSGTSRLDDQIVRPDGWTRHRQDHDPPHRDRTP